MTDPDDTAAIQAQAAADVERLRAHTMLVLGGLVILLCLGGAVLLAVLRVLEGSFVGYLLASSASAAITAIFLNRNGNVKP